MDEELKQAAAKSFYIGWRKGDVIGSKLHQEYLRKFEPSDSLATSEELQL